MSDTTVTILVENSVLPGSATIAEHGFSALVQTGSANILFDTGQGNVLPTNADVLGVDLTGLDAIVLSHGHYDHAGGLACALDAAGETDVYIGEGCFAKKFARHANGETREIGVPASRESLEAFGARFVDVDGPTRIADGILATGPIPRTTDFETVESMLFVESEDGLVPDDVAGDQALVLETDKGIVVVTGCAHAGVVNTLRYVRELTGKDRFHALIGGVHLAFSADDRIAATIREIDALDIEILAPAHCTGFRAFVSLCAGLPEKLLPCSVGSKFVF